MLGISDELAAVVDADGIVLDANDRFADALSLGPVELAGRPLTDLVHPQSRQRMLRGIRALIGGDDGRLALECRVGRRDHWRWVDWRARANGGAVVLTGRDITDERKRRSSTQIAARLESLRTLAGGVAHEINTPVQYLGDNIEFLELAFARMILALRASGCCSPELEFIAGQVPEALAQSRDGIECIAQVVRAMTSFCRPGSGRRRGRVDVHELLDDVIEAARTAASSAQFEQDFDDKLPPITGYREQLHQALADVINSAATTIREAAGVLKVATRKSDASLLISISDSAGGCRESLDQLFDPFADARSFIDGRGLAHAYSVIVVEHGGAIEVSGGDAGSTVDIRLPLAAGPKPTSEVAL